jgi:alpha-tubulin suppressor-like RCC1 family protein
LYFFYFFAENGKLYMWGKNSHCILPNRPTGFKIWMPFCINTGLSTVKTISCGSWHAVAVTGIPGKSNLIG